MTNDTTRWFKENLVLLSATYDMGHLNTFYSNSVAWIVEKRNLASFKIMMASTDTHMVEAKTTNRSHSKVYFTTPYGLVIVDQLNENDVFEFMGLRVLKLEIPRTHWFSDKSPLVKQLANLTTDQLMERNALVNEQAKEKELRRQAYQDNLASVKKTILASCKDEGFADLVDRAFGFDHNYHYTDDGAVWRRAQTHRNQLVKEFNEFGVNGEVAMSTISSAHSS